MSRQSRHGALRGARARLVRQKEVGCGGGDASGGGSFHRTRLSRLPDEDCDHDDDDLRVSTGDASSSMEAEEAVASDAEGAAGAADKTSAGGRPSVTAAIDVEIALQESPTRVTVSVRLVTLVCCSQKTVWVFRSRGLTRLGQTELMLVLERLSSDSGIPADVIRLFSGVLGRARAGETVGDLDHTVFHSSASFLGSSYIGGILYFMDSGQCFHGLVSPADQCSLLLCRLVHTRETSLLMHAPLRLLLRMGQEDGVYPCSIISHRFRPALFHESCRSVYAMFKDVVPHSQGLIPRLRECQVSLEATSVTVSVSRRRHPELLALLRLYAPDADGVVAFGGELCQFADAHLVAMEMPGVGCETIVFKAKTARKPIVTGASFVAVAAHSLPGGRSSVGISGNVAAVVEDGVAVTCRRDDMKGLIQSLKCAVDFTITADWLFPTQRKKVHTKCPIRFVWRQKPGQ